MPPAPPPLNLSELQFEADILHLIFHRGRNSHHCNGWWKWLSMLRRNINKLLDPTYAQELKARLEYMRTILVPICYRAFTSLIAGTHLAPMGLTLLAILARVHKVIRGQKKEEEEEEEEVVEEKMVAEVPEEVKVKGTGLVVGLVTMEDFGETIRREVKEGKEEEEKMVVPEKKVAGKEVAEKKVVKKHKAVTQELTKTSKMLKKSNQLDRGGISSGPIAKAEAKKERAIKKMKAMEMVSNSQLPPPSPPIIKEPPKIKSKRKSEDKEEKKKKKKRKKGDEIDDLFAGLL